MAQIPRKALSLSLVCLVSGLTYVAFSYGSLSLGSECASDHSGDSDLALIMMSFPHPQGLAIRKGDRRSVGLSA